MSDISNREVVDPRSTPEVPAAAGRAPSATPSHGYPASSPASTKDVAADEARSVAQDAKSGAGQVADTAKQQAGDVVQEARTQAREVYSQAKQELASHAADQHRRAGAGLHSLAEELHGMVDRSDEGGIATDAARQAAASVSSLAGWFDSHEPGDALQELRGFARRRPGAFLAGAAVVGLLAGRLTRGGVEEARDNASDSPSDSSSSTGSADRPAHTSVTFVEPGLTEPMGAYGTTGTSSLAEPTVLSPTTSVPVEGPYDALPSEPGRLS